MARPALFKHSLNSSAVCVVSAAHTFLLSTRDGDAITFFENVFYPFKLITTTYSKLELSIGRYLSLDKYLPTVVQPI